MMSEDPSHPIDGFGNEMMQELLKSVRSIDERLVSLEARVDERLVSLEARVDERLASLEAKVDERLSDTRPIWERALAEIRALRVAHEQTNARLDQLAAGQDQLRAGQDKLGTELRDEMRMGFHKVERQLMLLGRDFLQIRSELIMLEDRVEKLEPQPS